SLIDLQKAGFGHTELGAELGEKLNELNQWSEHLARSIATGESSARELS
ncbi:MAG: hypothetical protein ACI9P7_000357, partial [Candidatus Azotimanducaceae bacterium]